MNQLASANGTNCQEISWESWWYYSEVGVIVVILQLITANSGQFEDIIVSSLCFLDILDEVVAESYLICGGFFEFVVDS